MRRFLDAVRRPPWRAPALALAIVGVVAIAYAIWSPGEDDRSGRHSRGRNAIWMQHGWLGADAWFVENKKVDRMADFRDPQRIETMLRDLRSNGISDLFPHLCPAGDDGRIAPADDAQVERVLDAAAMLNERGEPLRVMPWIGGRREGTAHVDDPAWRRAFVASARDMLERHPRLAGVHVNIEPWRDGDVAGLALLDELRAGLPPGKLISVSGYPPWTIWHPFPDVHWREPYFREVSRRCDQIAVMMYDTALRQEKIYRWLVASWTRDVLAWSDGAYVLIGVPTYEDSGTPWHVPRVENLENAMLGLHAGLGRGELPFRYQGVAIYSDWETSSDEWLQWRYHLLLPGHEEATTWWFEWVDWAVILGGGFMLGMAGDRRGRWRRALAGGVVTLLAIAAGIVVRWKFSSNWPFAADLVAAACLVGLGILAGCVACALEARARTAPPSAAP